MAAVSPLLTCAHLWQVKEWRWDRLREHLRSEGWFRQLFGVARPLLLSAFLALWVLYPAELAERSGVYPMQLTREVFTLAGLSSLALLSLLQIAVGKQPYPVWTKKAFILVLTSLFLTTSLIPLLRTDSFVLLTIPLLQPFTLALAWFMWWPIDRTLKQRIIKRAMRLRAQFPDLMVIGVTGSVGKSTTKELLAHILPEAKATPAHVNTELGVAQWLTEQLSDKSEVRLPAEALAKAGSSMSTPRQARGALRLSKGEVLIIEMGAYRRGEIALLCEITKPKIGIVTYVGTQHLALFGSETALFEAKAELVASLPQDGRAFLNGDSALSRRMRERARCPVTIVGTGGPCDLEAFDAEETSRGVRFTATGTHLEIPLRGTHNIVNVLLAIACAQHLGVPLPTIAERLRTFSPLKHTFEVRSEQGVLVLDDTHNASPASFKAAIAWARSQPFERKVLLTSGLIELGEAQERIHVELGGFAAEVFDDVLFLHRNPASQFQRGYGRTVRILSPATPSVPRSSLLVCIGRMPHETIRRLLPQ